MRKKAEIYNVIRKMAFSPHQNVERKMILKKMAFYRKRKP